MIIVAAAGIMWAACCACARRSRWNRWGSVVLSVVSSAINGGLAWVMLQSARSTARWRWRATPAT